MALTGVTLAGVALLALGVARAQLVESLRLGQQRTYRWNEQRTGFGFDPAGGALGFEGLLVNQMPAYLSERTITSGPDRGREVVVPNPDLQWYFPMDVEGASLEDNEGNTFPIGYALEEIHSSPTVASVDIGGSPVLSVVFGSGGTVRRDIRNTLPPNGVDDLGDGRAGFYTANGVYNSDRDPYAYLHRQYTGAIFSIEALGGTREEFSPGTNVERQFKPLWWYGVRNLPWYRAGEVSLDPTNTASDEFRESPSLLQHRFFINASDTAMRAFDYAPNEARNPEGAFGPEPADPDQTVRRQKLFTQYLAPELDATVLSGNETGPGYDSGAGWVGQGRPDLPERLTDRLYNLNVQGPRFGLHANRDDILNGGDEVTPVQGGLDNRFRLTSGMGAINSTGLLLRLSGTATYRSRYYNLRDDSTDAAVETLQAERRDPGEIEETTGLSSQYLYIVGSDDGYVYAIDANPANARRVPETGGGALFNTHMGRLVWAFRAAVRAPLYTHDRADLKVTTMNPAQGEGPGTVAVDATGAVYHLNDSDKKTGIVIANGGLITGPIVSSPVGTVITIPDTPSILAPQNLKGQARSVVYVGSEIGRLFCLDAATGQQIWEFKTTPRGQTRTQFGTESVLIDSVQGYAIKSAPTLGFVPGATSQLRPSAPAGRLAVFFAADDGKVYALDAEDGSPLRENAALPGWDVPTFVDGGAEVNNQNTDVGTRYRLDHFGFVTYSFERGGARLPATTFDGAYSGDKYGRRRSEFAKPLNASVVARPSTLPGYVEPITGHTIPAVDRLFISSPTNQADATTGDDPAFTGGTIFAVDPKNGRAVWTFDRWEDVTRATNGDFDEDPGKDRFIRPGAFHVSTAYASNINIFDEAQGANGSDDPLALQDVLFAVDGTGKVFALRTDDNLASINRLYWRVPYALPSNPGQSGNLYSSPVVSTPNAEGDQSLPYFGTSFVFIGVSDGIAAVSTTALRNDLLLGPDGKPLAGDAQYTGGEIAWAWTTPHDSVELDDTVNPPAYQYVSEARPVVTTPAIHIGYLWAGADNGLMYAWRNTESGFSYGNAGGNVPYRGGNRRRQTIPDPTGTGDATSGTSTVEFYVDAFQAGFGYVQNFTPNGVKNISPTGAPLASGSGAGVNPPPVGEQYEEFKTPTGGILEWGDPLALVAWGPGLDARFATDGDEGRVNFQVTGPSTTGSLLGGLEQNGTQVYSRQIFYLNPFGSFVPPAMRYPGPLAGIQGRNPLANQMLAPGYRGQNYTVRGYYQGPSYVDERGNTRRQAQVPAKVSASTKFYLANPLNISAYFGGNAPTPLVGFAADLKTVYAQFPDATRNGNERVPVVASMIGDHGTSTTLPQPGNLLRVADRSNLRVLRTKASGWGVPNEGLANLSLRVRVQPQQLRWMGGPQAAYKPLLIRNTANDPTGRPALPNGIPLPSSAPPEPLFTSTWGPQRASFWNTNAGGQYFGAEQPPYLMGEANRSLDYPDVDASASSWTMRPNILSPSERDASAMDAPVPDTSMFYLKASVPKYQPANYSPPNIDPSDAGAAGVGPGYYTINPANMSAPFAAVMGWNPGRSPRADFYKAFDDPSETNNNPLYWGPMQSTLLPSATLAAQEANYLTKVYVDVNGNGTADISNGEAYRMFVSGVQVRPDERIRVATTTISVPNEPESAIPGGFIPFQYYWDRQVAAANGTPPEGDRFLFGQRNLFAPFDVYNNGNVNLWNVRLSKYDPMGGHLLAPDVDPAEYAGASTLSNWPASGVIKRFNLASTLDPLPIAPSGNPGQGPAGSPNDASLWTPSPKPRPAGMGDEGLGQRMLVKDVFAFRKDQATGQVFPERAHGTVGVAGPAGRPYLSVAIPPGTTPGTYATEYGRLVLFEDTGAPYANRDYNGILDMQGGTPLEPGVNSDAVVTVRVAESRLTDKVSRYAPFLPQADAGVAMSATPPTIGATPSDQELAGVWQRLAQDATPAAYRDPATGHLVTFWSSNRVGQVTPGQGFQPTAPFSPSNVASSKYHIFGTAMRWQDPINPPIDPGASIPDFQRDTLAQNPWGWNYQGDRMGSFFFPDFGAASWFGEPTASPWIPDSATVNAALGLPDNTVDPLDLTYTSPGVITDFHGTSFPPVLFWTGSTGVGPDARSAIFYAPIQVTANGEVSSGDIQAVGVTGGQRTLDPFANKFGPRPFLITAGGTYAPAGRLLPTSYLNNEQVIGLGVAWFGGAPGAWKLFVSTIKTDNTGNAIGDGQWTTQQLALPAGVASALHPSVYYHQMPKVVQVGDEQRRFGVLEVAFTGYSRSGRNPDIYLARYIAAQGDQNWNTPSIGGWGLMGFARQGGRLNDRAAKPLEQMVRVAGEPRPIYRSNWAAWQGRGQVGVTVYWFRKPVAAQGGATRLDDFQLYATFTARRAGANGVVEAEGRLANRVDRLPNVTAFIDTGGGTVRFATSDPVNNPAPLSRPYVVDGIRVQDYIYVAMSPYAMRVTTDDQVSDTMPQVWMDETHEVITEPRRTNVDVSPQDPLNIRRDRLWVLWRRAAQPEGATRVSSLSYKTFRLGIEVGEAIRLVNGRPDVSVSFLNNDATDVEPVVVDAQSGRVYFTSFNDGDEVRVTVNGREMGDFTIGWIPEGVSTPGRLGLGNGPGETYRLPLGQWVEPRAVPTLEHRDDSQPWMFKDPFSDLAPGTPGYYQRGNNNMWLFWSSTRPSHALGAARPSPMEPSYWDAALGTLTYAGSASDVYYTTLSPDFSGR